MAASATLQPPESPSMAFCVCSRTSADPCKWCVP